MRIALLHIALAIFVIHGSAQTTPINDEGMKTCLINEYPSLIDFSDSSLIVANANAHNAPVICHGYDIQDISIVSEFTQAWEINLTEAHIPYPQSLTDMVNLSKIVFLDCEIDSLPDLSALLNLNYLDVRSSGLKIFPRLNSNIKNILLTNNAITNVDIRTEYNQLKQLLMNTNEISSFSGLENISNIEKLYLGDSELNSLPSFESLDSLQELLLFSNNLNEVIGLDNKPNLQIVNLSDNNFDKVPEFVNSQPSSLNISANNLTFEDILPLTADVAFLSTPSLYQKQRVQGTSDTTTLNINDNWIWTLDFDQGISSNYYLWYKDSILIDSTITGSFEIEQVTSAQEGTYYCEVKNTILDSLVISVQPRTVVLNTFMELSEPIAFSPNGDGDNDELYIKFEGKTKIYNTKGELIIELESPALWDGTNQDGVEAEFGYYFIMVEGEHKISATLVR